MDKLRTYINGLDPQAREAFAKRCNTSLGYLRKAMSMGQPLGEGLCIAIERESGRAVRCEDLRPKTDWAYIRGTKNPRRALAKVG